MEVVLSLPDQPVALPVLTKEIVVTSQEEECIGQALTVVNPVMKQQMNRAVRECPELIGMQEKEFVAMMMLGLKTYKDVMNKNHPPI